MSPRSSNNFAILKNHNKDDTSTEAYHTYVYDSWLFKQKHIKYVIHIYIWLVLVRCVYLRTASQYGSTTYITTRGVNNIINCAYIEVNQRYGSTKPDWIAASSNLTRVIKTDTTAAGLVRDQRYCGLTFEATSMGKWEHKKVPSNSRSVSCIYLSYHSLQYMLRGHLIT